MNFCGVFFGYRKIGIWTILIFNNLLNIIIIIIIVLFFSIPRANMEKEAWENLSKDSKIWETCITLSDANMEKEAWENLSKDRKIWEARITLADVAYYHLNGRSGKDEASRRGIPEKQWLDHVERCFRFVCMDMLPDPVTHKENAIE